MDATSKSIHLNMNNITKQAQQKEEYKSASERIQSELRPKSDASKWYSDQANRNRTEESQRAMEQAGQTVRGILKGQRGFTEEESMMHSDVIRKVSTVVKKIY